MLFPMLPGAKSYDQPIASYMAFKLGVTLFSITLYIFQSPPANLIYESHGYFTLLVIDL